MRNRFPAGIALLFLTAVLLPGSAFVHAGGEAVDCIASSGEPSVTDLPDCRELFPAELYPDEVSPWRFGLGAGYGRRSNPLINSDSVPVYGIVRLSYFGDHFFFDNGDFGWVLAERDLFDLNLIAGVGGERSFYSFLNKSPVSFPALEDPSDFSPSPPVPIEVPEGYEPEAPDRDFVIDGGLELIYQSRQLEWQLQVLTDISDKHNGQEVWLSASRLWRHGRWQVVPAVGVTWQSADTANYYYGVRESEALPMMPAYKVGAAFNPFARFSLSYGFDEHWRFVASGQYERLADEISDSSSVADDHVTTFFTGLYYEF